MNYFEQPDVWDPAHRLNAAERQRIEETMGAIPRDVTSLLDVGCGSGLFLSALGASHERTFSRLAGLDESNEALRSVKGERHQGSLVTMPFADREFDIVMCLEVLEHIKPHDLNAGLSEIARIAHKYILVTVPNQEQLIQSLVICPTCACCFSPWHHVRSFDEKSMPHLFEGFMLRECKCIGPLVKRRAYGGTLKAALLAWRRPSPPSNSICPQCGHRQPRKCLPNKTRRPGIRELQVQLLSGSLRLLMGAQQRKKWILALYSRTDGGSKENMP